MIQTTLVHHQLAIGINTLLFYLAYKRHIGLTSKTLITCLWEFVCGNDIMLTNHGTNMDPSRLHDRALMSILKEDHNISTAVEESINRMKCYLEVLSLADITTGGGTKIRPCLIYCIKGDTISSWDWAEE